MNLVQVCVCGETSQSLSMLCVCVCVCVNHRLMDDNDRCCFGRGGGGSRGLRCLYRYRSGQTSQIRENIYTTNQRKD